MEETKENIKENKKEETKESPKKQLNTGSFIKELLSGSMVSEKIILKNLGYIIVDYFPHCNLHW